jgi:hypothetical protein
MCAVIGSARRLVQDPLRPGTRRACRTDSAQLNLSLALTAKTQQFVQIKTDSLLKSFCRCLTYIVFSSILVFYRPISLYFSQDHSIFSSLAIFLTIVLSLPPTPCSPSSYAMSSPILFSLFLAFFAWREPRAIMTQVPCRDLLFVSAS